MIQFADLSPKAVKARILRIEAEAKSAGVTIGEMCDQAGINPLTFRRWKSGECSPTVAKLHALEMAAASLLQRSRDKLCAEGINEPISPHDSA